MKEIFIKLKKYGSLVMFSHTLFSLPFAVVALLWANEGRLPGWRVIVFSLLALAGARNGANSLNRIVDLKFDSENPRLLSRVMVTGEVSKPQAIGFTVFCFAVYFFSAAMLGPLCLALSPLPFVVIFLYSYTKRWTFFCHLVLGTACASAPFGAWIAVRGIVGWTALALAAAVACWVAGFDILYAIQDIEFDREKNLRSVPAKFGETGARIAAVCLHLAATGFLAFCCLNQGILVWVGLVVCFCVLAAENLLRGKWVYLMNQCVSVSFMAFVLLDWAIGLLG